MRIIRYDQPPLEERWRTCPPANGPEPEQPPTATTPTPPPTSDAEPGGGLFG